MKRILLATAAILAAPCLAQAAPYIPSYGSPNSLQAQIATSAVNLDSAGAFEGFETGDATVDAANADVEGDADTIGFAFTHWDGSGMSGQRYEGRYQKAWRPVEGSRMRAIVDVPVNILSTDGETAVNVVLSGGLELPVNPNWNLTPRLSYGVTQAGAYYGGDGEIASASVTSRYRFPQVGRGDLVIANMVGYTTTFEGFTDKLFPGADSKNWVFRNGFAYQYPMQALIMGRQASGRFSITQTHLEGDPAFIEDYLEVAYSIGVRGREGSLRNTFEALRFGVIWTHADDYDSGTLTFGYRF